MDSSKKLVRLGPRISFLRIGGTICTCREIQCLPYGGFFHFYFSMHHSTTMSATILLVYISLSIAAQHGYVGKNEVLGWVVGFINGVSKHSQEPH